MLIYCTTLIYHLTGKRFLYKPVDELKVIGNRLIDIKLYKMISFMNLLTDHVPQ